MDNDDKDFLMSLKSDSKILKYFKNQLKLKEEELKAYQMPLSEQEAMDPRKVELMVLQRQYFWLKGMIDAADTIIEDDREAQETK